MNTIFPEAEHKHNIRHICQNFLKKYKGETLKNDLWSIVRSTNIPSWQKHMDKLYVDNAYAFDWIEEAS
jgi:hypothetical protein